MSESNEKKTIAYGDESVLLVADPPLYLVGASVFNANADVVRRALERVKLSLDVAEAGSHHNTGNPASTSFPPQGWLSSGILAQSIYSVK